MSKCIEETQVEVVDAIIKSYVLSVNGKTGHVILTSKDVGAVALKNLIKQWSTEPSDDNTPSEKLVKTTLDTAIDNLDLTKLDKAPDGTINLIDGNNKISISYLPEGIIGTLKYMGTWNASIQGKIVGVQGNYYICTTGGVYDPSGGVDINWTKGDWAIYNGTTWDKIDAQNEVVSVNGKTGAVVLKLEDFTPVALTNTGDGTKFLSDDGEYKKIDIDPDNVTITKNEENKIQATAIKYNDTIITAEMLYNATHFILNEDEEEPLVWDRIFGNNTPAQISAVSKQISENNYTSEQVAEIYGWNLGDTIDITLTTDEVTQMQIVGFNHYDKTDGSGKAGILLQSVNLLNTLYQMNTTSTNVGGFTISVMKTTHLPKTKATFPQEWQDNMLKVDIKSANGGSTYTETVTTSEDIFIPAEIEVIGTKQLTPTGANEGTQYEYWIGKSTSDRIKQRSGSNYFWWLRSPSLGDSSRFCAVYSTGSLDYGSAGLSLGVSVCLCI